MNERMDIYRTRMKIVEKIFKHKLFE